MTKIQEIQEIVTPIARRYGVERMYLFGSCARGTNTEESDIDLRIDKGQVQGLQMAFLLSDLEDALHQPVDLLSTTALDDGFLQSIAKEEKLLYARETAWEIVETDIPALKRYCEAELE